jgi:recombination protein RecT
MTAAAKPEVGTAVALPTQITKASFKTDVARWAPEIEKVATRGFTSDRVLAAALQAAVHEPKIFEATPQSLYLALMKSARWALDIGDTCHLVPLNKKISKRGEPDRYAVIVELWPDYKGLKALAMRQGIIRGMEEFVVFEGDQFDYQLGMDAFLRHQPNANPAKRGKITGAYTVIRLPHNDRSFNYMPIDDIEAIRAKSKSWGPTAYPKCPAWYAKKTVVRDYLNRQPKQGALSEALAADDTEEFDRETGEVFAQPQISGPAASDDPELDDRKLDEELLDQEDGS